MQLFASPASAGFRPITVNLDWGSEASASPATSPTRTLDVPSGTGTLEFAESEGSGQLEYQHNGGAWTSVAPTLGVSDADTLALRLVGVITDTRSVAVTDAARGTGVGGFLGEINA